MLSVTFDAIYSRFLSKVQAYDLLEMVTDDCYEQMNEWLKSVKSNPRVRKCFTTLTLDDVGKQISFELRNPVDNDDDMDFVIEVFGLGIAWKWITPQYNTLVNTAPFFGSKEMKWYSQANHMSEVKNMYDTARVEMYKCIASHGYYNNPYVKEEK